MRPMDASERHDRPADSDTRRQARDHLLLNFTDMGGYAEAGSKVIVRGDGCEVIDDWGRRFIDGLSGLFCSNLGHSYGDEIGAAAHRQLATHTRPVDGGSIIKPEERHQMARHCKRWHRVLSVLRWRGARTRRPPYRRRA